MHNYLIKKGTTDVSVELRIVDSIDGTPETGVVWNTAGIDLQYRRDGAASTAITEATLAALTTAHTDGGFLHIGNGIYRFDLPDAACASGVDKVVVHGTVTGMVVIGCVIQLTDIDMFDGVRAGMTALPNAAADAAGGLPTSDAGGLDLDTLLGYLTGNVALASVCTEVRLAELAAANLPADIDTLLTRIVGTLAAGTHNPASAAQIAVLSDWINAGRLDTILDTIAADVVNIDGAAMRGTDNAALATSLTTVDTVVDAIKVITDALPDAGALTTLITHLTDIKGGTFSGATDSLEAIRDRGDAAWITGAGGTPPQLLQSTTIATLATQTSFTLTAGSADDDAYTNAIVVITDSVTSTQKAVGTVSAYTGATKTVTLSADPAVFTMAAGDTIEVIAALGSAGSAPTAVQIRQEIDTNSTKLTDILADTNELQLDDIPTTLAAIVGYVDTLETRLTAARAGYLDELGPLNIPTDLSNINTLIAAVQTDLDNGVDGLGALKILIDAIKAETALIVQDSNELQTDNIPALIAAVQTEVNKIGTPAGLSIAADLAAIKQDTATIVIDTNELQGDWTNGGRLDLIIDAILADTSAEVTLSVTERNAIADAILDRDMSTGTDSGSTTVRTLRNAVRAGRNKVTIAGGVITVYKEDDTTVAWTGVVTTAAGNPISGVDPAG